MRERYRTLETQLKRSLVLGRYHTRVVRAFLEELHNSGIGVPSYITDPESRMVSNYNFYDHSVNWRGLYIPSSEQKMEWLTSQRSNVPIYYKRNVFCVNSMLAIGGGGIKQVKRALSYRRIGGSTQDKINYICSYSDKSVRDLKYNVSFNKLNEILLIKGKVAFPPFKDAIQHSNFNFQASPGSLLKNLGFKTKTDTLIPDLLAGEIVYVSWCTKPDSELRPKEVWSVAARPKLKQLDYEKLESIRDNKPCCRAISYCSGLEQILGLPLWLPVSLLFEQRFKETMCGIAIGINRLGTDWIRLGRSFNGAHRIYIGDYSKYDQTIPRHLIIRAFDYMFSLFEDNPITSNYISNFRRWMIDNIVDKTYLLDNILTMQVNSGIPSGSLWTSLLGSVCNIIIISEVMNEMGIDNYTPVVYGDDHMILIYEKINDKTFIKNFLRISQAKFGVTGTKKDAWLSTPDKYFVTYERPVYKPGDYLSKGTRDLPSVSTERDKSPFVSWDHTKGTTHRWNYTFSRRVRFLQYYFLTTGHPIRPWGETLMRIINPENAVKTPMEHDALLISHLIDNYNNAHCRNWVYHLLYDNIFQKRMFDYKSNRLPPLGQLAKNPSALKLLEREDPSLRGRAWYRHVDYHVDLMSDSSMADFNYRWARICKVIENIQCCETSIPFYRVKDVILELLKKGVTSQDTVKKLFSNPSLFKGHLNSYFELECGPELSNVQNNLIDSNTKISSMIGCDYASQSLAFKLLPPLQQIGLSIRVKSYTDWVNGGKFRTFEESCKHFIPTLRLLFEPVDLKGNLSTLIHNDLQLISAPWINSGMLEDSPPRLTA